MIIIVISKFFFNLILSHITWKRHPSLLSGEEYIGNELVSKESAAKGYKKIINKKIFNTVKELFHCESYLFTL